MTVNKLIKEMKCKNGSPSCGLRQQLIREGHIPKSSQLCNWCELEKKAEDYEKLREKIDAVLERISRWGCCSNLERCQNTVNAIEEILRGDE